MALRSLRQGFQEQDRLARRQRAIRRWHRQRRRALQLRERERRLAYRRAIHSHRMRERKTRIDAAQRDRVRMHKAMLARRQAKLQARRSR